MNITLLRHGNAIELVNEKGIDELCNSGQFGPEVSALLRDAIREVR